MPSPMLILSPRFSDDSRAIRGAALEAGWEIVRLPSWRPPEDFAARAREQEVVLYGESLFCARLASELDLSLLAAPHDFLARLPHPHLLRKVSYMSLADARALPDRAFYKPAEDKWFRADVYSRGADIPGVDELPDGDPVLVSEPVVFEVEYRCFVLEGAVASAGIYLRHGELAEHEMPVDSEQEEALACAQAVLLAVECPPAFVLDVGRIAERGWAVVEANPAWGAGVYGCDPAAVLPVLRRATRRNEAVTDADRPWLPPRPQILG